MTTNTQTNTDALDDIDKTIDTLPRDPKTNEDLNKLIDSFRGSLNQLFDTKNLGLNPVGLVNYETDPTKLTLEKVDDSTIKNALKDLKVVRENISTTNADALPLFDAITADFSKRIREILNPPSTDVVKPQPKNGEKDSNTAKLNGGEGQGPNNGNGKGGDAGNGDGYAEKPPKKLGFFARWGQTFRNIDNAFVRFNNGTNEYVGWANWNSKYFLPWRFFKYVGNWFSGAKDDGHGHDDAH